MSPELQNLPKESGIDGDKGFFSQLGEFEIKK